MSSSSSLSLHVHSLVMLHLGLLFASAQLLPRQFPFLSEVDVHSSSFSIARLVFIPLVLCVCIRDVYTFGFRKLGTSSAFLERNSSSAQLCLAILCSSFIAENVYSQYYAFRAFTLTLHPLVLAGLFAGRGGYSFFLVAFDVSFSPPMKVLQTHPSMSPSLSLSPSIYLSSQIFWTVLDPCC
jgi:hypothetical protein